MDFTGIWQLNDKQSDSPATITRRLHAQIRREQAPSSRPAGASSSAAPSSSSSPSGGHGRGMGGMGGGHGMGGGGRHGSHDAKDQSSGNSAPHKDPTPPLLADDALLNIQQDRKGMQVDFNNTDRLDTRFDGITRQSLNGSAQVRTELTPDGMQVSMTFDDGTRLDQAWVRSADGHHLTVTETWTTANVEEPIVFQRSYDRLDL
ncbi:hypothetical protein GCM10027066_00940 [Dyella jejuensis]